MAQNNDQLISSLVSRLTGLKENTREWDKAVSKTKYNLSYYKFTSTSENEVNTSYSNLAEKFKIKGHVEFANELLRQKNDFTDSSKWIGSVHANQKVLKYDLLRLLLAMSSSKNQTFEFTSTERRIASQEKLSWEQLLEEEPMEGDHWKTWSDYSSSSDEYQSDQDKDDFELDREQLKRRYNTDHSNTPDQRQQQQQQQQLPQEYDYTEQMDLDTRQNNNALEYLISQQYWRQQTNNIHSNNNSNNNNNNDIIADEMVGTSILHHPFQLNKALCDRFYTPEEKKSIRTLNEADVIREVLFLLKGCEGVLFKYVESEDQFILDEHYLVQHLSQHSLASLLNEFCVYGNMIGDLRVIVTRIANRIQFGQTSQAFATSVSNLLIDFEYQLSGLEADTRFTTMDPTKIISLLKLRNTLNPTLQVLGEIHSIAINIPFDNNEPVVKISSYLISVIYERTLVAQSSEQTHIHTHLLNIFEQTVVPFGRMMDDWVFYGNLEIDKANEFYVKRRMEIQKDQQDFWKLGFLVEMAATESSSIYFKCPLFDQRIVERVFFTGKAINLLTRMNKLPADLHPNFFSDVIAKCLSGDHDGDDDNEVIEQVEPDEVEDVGEERRLGQDEQIASVDAEEEEQEQVGTEEMEENDNTSNSDNHNNTVEIETKRDDIKFDAFTMALFPLLNSSSSSSIRNTINDKRMEPSPIGVLFDQLFIQAVDKYIEKPYHQVANHLNQVLHQECGLTQQLRTLSSVYLMLENDLMHSFCESLFIQMDKQSNWFDEIILNRIYLETSELSGYKDIVYIHIDNSNGQLGSNPMLTTCLSLIRFNVQIKWPLNNFIQSSSLTEYGRITSFLMRLKRAKYVLEKRTLFGRERAEKSDRNSMRFYSIRMKMLWFVNAFWRYVMTTILHSETLKFYNNLSKTKDADEITALHNSYVRRIVDYCLLNDKSVSIKKSIIQIMDLTERMGDLFKRFMIMSMVDDQQSLFNSEMDTIEKEFDGANKFITASLNILGRKTNLPWFESLASSLSAQ